MDIKSLCPTGVTRGRGRGSMLLELSNAYWAKLVYGFSRPPPFRNECCVTASSTSGDETGRRNFSVQDDQPHVVRCDGGTVGMTIHWAGLLQYGTGNHGYFCLRHSAVCDGISRDEMSRARYGCVVEVFPRETWYSIFSRHVLFYGTRQYHPRTPLLGT